MSIGPVLEPTIYVRHSNYYHNLKNRIFNIKKQAMKGNPFFCAMSQFTVIMLEVAEN